MQQVSRAFLLISFFLYLYVLCESTHWLISPDLYRENSVENTSTLETRLKFRLSFLVKCTLCLGINLWNHCHKQWFISLCKYFKWLMIHIDVHCLGSMCCQNLMRPRGAVESAWQTITGEEGNLSLSQPTPLKTTTVIQPLPLPPPPLLPPAVITPNSKLQTLVSLFLINWICF